jgi:hypothetical protein
MTEESMSAPCEPQIDPLPGRRSTFNFPHCVPAPVYPPCTSLMRFWRSLLIRGSRTVAHSVAYSLPNVPEISARAIDDSKAHEGRAQNVPRFLPLLTRLTSLTDDGR